MMWKLYKTAIGGSSSVTLPVTFVLDADRNVAYAQTGYDVTGLRQTLAGNDPTNYSDDIHEYDFVMKYGQSEARSMLSDVNALRTGSEAWAWDSSNTTKVHYDASPLTYDYGLELNAMKRAAEIAIYYSHTRPNGESCFTAYTVQRGARAENIAMGYPSADSVFEAWCENDENYSGQGHRRNMLGSYSYIGIGHVFFNGTHFWVQEFSTAPTDLTKSTAFDSNTVVTIEILDSLIEGSSYLLDSYDYNLKKGESDTLPKVYKTLTVPNGTVNVEEVQPTWSISDKKVATISGNKIKAVGGGKAKLTASYDNWTDYIFINVTVSNCWRF